MKVAIVPVGRIDPDIVDEAELCVRQLFGCDVQRCTPIEIPAGSFDAKRRQYNSVAFMLALAKGDFGAADRVLGLTATDLFIPMLTFVFGQAQLSGRCGLVSLARLDQRFYGAVSDPELLKLRMSREIGHELGHSFGLVHCPLRECLMSLATSIQEVDRKSGGFCGTCRRILNQEISEEKNESEMADPRRR